MKMKFRLPGRLILAVGLTLTTTLDRYAGRSEHLVPVVSPGIAVLGAQSAPRDTGNQPRGSVGTLMDRAPRLVVTSARQQGGDAVAIDNDDIGGVVTGANGPEAGVWVIAETTDLPTRFAKIVVTDDRGRYLVPDLP